MFHTLKKENMSNTQDDPSATSHVKNGWVFTQVSRFSSICKLTSMPVSHKVPFLFKECTPSSCKQKPLQLHTPFIYKSPKLITAVTHTQLLSTSAMALSSCHHSNKSLPTPCCFTPLVFVHRLLTVSSFVMHYVPPYVDPSHPPVASHSTLLFWVASSQRGACASGIEEVEASWTGSPAVLINEDVQSFLKDTGFGKLDLIQKENKTKKALIFKTVSNTCIRINHGEKMMMSRG